MIKLACVCMLFVSCSVNAMQSKQEIIDYCTRQMLVVGGNKLVLFCIEQELEAKKKIEELTNADAR